MLRRNQAVSQLLENIAKFLEIAGTQGNAAGAGSDYFRIRAYEEAARYVAAMDEDVAQVRAAGRLEEIPGVGESIAAKIAEYLDTGQCAYYEGLKRRVPVRAVELLEVPGIGPSRARQLTGRLHITTVAELEQAAREHKLRELPGFGAKLEDQIAREAGGTHLGKESRMAGEYGFGKTMSMPYDEAIAALKEALKAEGFGVLSEIDVARTLREKLGEEIKPYVILGACNPQLAHQALGLEPDIGLLLPCNVVVRAHEAGSRVEVVDPEAMLGIAGNRQLAPIAREAKQRLSRALASLPEADAASTGQG